MKKQANWKGLCLGLVQLALVGLWLYWISQHELYSPEGYVYNQFNGLYLLCGAAGLGAMVDNLRHPERWKGSWKAAAAGFGVFFALASVMANYSVFEPFATGRSWLNFAYCLAGGFVTGFHLLLFALARLPVKSRQDSCSHPVGLYLLTFAGITAVYLLYFFFVAYPGYFTRDSFAAVYQCLSGSYDNTSPFWHTMVVKLCMTLGGGDIGALWVYGLVQLIAMGAVFAYAVLTLRQAGVPKLWVGLAAAAYGLLNYHLAYSATMWKDIPFSLGALTFGVSLYRILRGIGSRTGNFVVFCVGSLFFCLMRTNGWYACLVTAVVLFFLLRKNQKVLLVLLALVLVLTWLCNNPLLDAWGVAETNFVEALAIPFQQIARVVTEEGTMDPEDRAFLGEIFDLEQVKQRYNPLTVDPVKFECLESREFLQEHLGEFALVWLRLGWQNPWLYTKAWIDETQGYWNSGYNFWVYSQGEDCPELGIYRQEQENPVKNAFDWLFHVQKSNPLISQPIHGIGFQIWLLLGCFLVCALQKRRSFLPAIPILVVVAGLWFGTPVFAEFRYAYPVFVTMPWLLTMTVFVPEE